MNLFGAIALFILAPISIANSAENVCGQVATYKDVLRCAEERSFDVQRAQAEAKRARLGVDAVTQLTNPNFSANAVTGKVGAESKSETDLTLGFPIELGGKRAARKDLAEKLATRAEIELGTSQLTARALTFLRLHRLRQLLREQHLIEESVATFTKLVRQYERRPQLSPEQQMTLSVFRVARSEYGLKMTESEDELSKISAFFRLVLGVETNQIKNAVPASPSVWPEVSDSFNADKSLQAKLLDADVALAQAERKQAESYAWPTLTVGPSMRLVEEGSNRGQLYGLNVSMPLPLLSLNSGAKAQALAGEQAATLKKNLGALERVSEREELLRTYKRSVASLKESLNSQELEKKHQGIESLFLRGIVPSSLVIEAHRTLVDSERARNAREIKAFETLLGIYALDGTLQGVEL